MLTREVWHSTQNHTYVVILRKNTPICHHYTGICHYPLSAMYLSLTWRYWYILKEKINNNGIQNYILQYLLSNLSGRCRLALPDFCDLTVEFILGHKPLANVFLALFAFRHSHPCWLVLLCSATCLLCSQVLAACTPLHSAQMQAMCYCASRVCSLKPTEWGCSLAQQSACVWLNPAAVTLFKTFTKLG